MVYICRRTALRDNYLTPGIARRPLPLVAGVDAERAYSLV